MFVSNFSIKCQETPNGKMKKFRAYRASRIKKIYSESCNISGVLNGF